MANENRKLQYLRDLSDYKVASGDPDVRGWTVVNIKHEPIGKVDSFLVDVEKEKVRYLDVDVDEEILGPDHEVFQRPAKEGVHEYVNRDGEVHMIIPIGAARINMDENVVECDYIREDFFQNPVTYRKGEEITPEYETEVVRTMSPSERNQVEDRDRFYEGGFFNQDMFYGKK